MQHMRMEWATLLDMLCSSSGRGNESIRKCCCLHASRIAIQCKDMHVLNGVALLIEQQACGVCVHM